MRCTISDASPLLLGLGELEITAATPGSTARVERAATRALPGVFVPLPPLELAAHALIDLMAENAVQHSAKSNDTDDDADGFFRRVEVHEPVLLPQMLDGLTASDAALAPAHLDGLGNGLVDGLLVLGQGLEPDSDNATQNHTAHEAALPGKAEAQAHPERETEDDEEGPSHRCRGYDIDVPAFLDPLLARAVPHPGNLDLTTAVGRTRNEAWYGAMATVGIGPRTSERRAWVTA